MSIKINDSNTFLTIKNDPVILSENSSAADNKYASVQEYSKALEQKYGYFNSRSFIGGVSVSVSVSEEYLKKCCEDPEIAASLEKKLDEFPDHAAGIAQKYSGNVKAVNLKFDDEGKPSVSAILSEEKDTEKSKAKKAEEEDEKSEEGRRSVAVNVEKRSRQIASAKTRDQIKAVIEMIRQDVSDCKEGLSNGWCDENEVRKAETLLKRAEEKQSQIPADSPENDDPNAEMEFLLNMLM